MIALVSSIFGVIALVLEIWMQNRPTAQEKSYANLQTGRQDISDGDVNAVNGRIDRLLSVPDGTDNPSGQQHGEVTPGRISAVFGVADPGRSTGPDTGKS